MPQRASNDTLIIGAALLIGLVSLAIPFAAIIWAPDSDFVKQGRRKPSSAPSTLVRNPRSTDLRSERLAFAGNCAVGDFKDHRAIEDTIRRQFVTYRLGALEVHVTDMCIAELHGVVRDERQRKEAIRAAGHPWVRAIDIADLHVSASSPPPDAPQKADR